MKKARYRVGAGHQPLK